MLDLTDRIIAYELGEMDEEEIVDLFQDLVNRGLAWQLQGSYGRMAARLIDEGLVTVPPSQRGTAQLEVEDL